jgi:hypothetical protein
MEAPPRRIDPTEGPQETLSIDRHPRLLVRPTRVAPFPEMRRTTYCRECNRELLDSRWWPLCPVCYESMRQEQRREQIRPPALEEPAWSDPAQLETGFESALGGEPP